MANCRNNQSFSGYTENKLHELKTKKIKSSNTSNTIKEIHKKHLLPRVQWVLNDNGFWKVGGNAADRSGVTNRLSRYIYLYSNLNFFSSNECLIYTCKGLLALLVWCIKLAGMVQRRIQQYGKGSSKRWKSVLVNWVLYWTFHSSKNQKHLKYLKVL